MQSHSANSVEAAAGFTVVPLFHAAWLFAAGIVVASRLWLRPSYVLISLILVAALSAFAAMRTPRVLRIPLATLWLLLGSWCQQMEPHPAPAPKLAALSDGLSRTVDGTVIDTGPERTELEQNRDEPSTTKPTQRIDLRVETMEVVNDESDTQEPVAGVARLTVRWPANDAASNVSQLHCGERIRVAVRLLPPEVYHDPGVWSREDYLLGQGITSTATVSADGIVQLGRARGAYISCRITSWQHETAARLVALPSAMRKLPTSLQLSEDDAVMLAAMVAGDRTYLTHTLRVGFERTGSFHMLVVSGFHLAIVAGCIFWVARRLSLASVPATLLTIAASFAYALFTGFATPVQRSLWMVALYLVGRLIYRERNALNTVGFAALCLLAASPRSLFDSSFQMTLLAVAAIAGVAAPLLQGTIHHYATAARNLRLVAIDIKLAPEVAEFRVVTRMFAERLARAGNALIAWRIFPWLIRFAIRTIEVIVVSVVVELAMTLPMAVYFHRITVFALPVNLLILPLLAVLMPAALLTLLLLVIWPTVAVIPAMVVALVMHAGVGLVHLFGSLSLGDLRVPGPLGWQSTAFIAFLGAAFLMAHGAVAGSKRWLRRGTWAALVAAALVSAVPRSIERPKNAMLVEAIDVGQGDSLLVITPDGKTLLVDGGGFSGGPREGTQSEGAQNFDIGEEVVSPALWARGIRHLDAVMLSHAHSDHMGGLPAVLRNFHPDELWVGNNPHFEAYDALLNEAAGLRVKVRTFRANDAFAFGNTQVNVLAPFRNYQPGTEPENDDSMVLHIAYGTSSALLEGDAEQPIEDAMLTEPGLQSTLLKVGHHGSITSTRPEFLARVAPQWAVISCGLHNRYGHPRQEVLEELQDAHVHTFRTDLNGISCFVLDGKTANETSCTKQ